MIECLGLTGSQAIPYINDLAALRCAVFRKYPYLYEGDPSAESVYLANYSKSENVFLVIAMFGDKVVGVSTCMAMSHADPAFQKPFINYKTPIKKICYFGESVLLPEFRGMGVGHRFFDLREQWATSQGFTTNVFCAVMRAEEDHRKPATYRSHDDFWMKRGFKKRDHLVAELTWREINDPTGTETSHKLVFWTND